MRMQKFWLMAFLTVASWQTAEAATITRAGTFLQDDQFVSVPFLVDQASWVWIETNSHVRGGFYPSLAVFEKTGGMFPLVGLAYGNNGVCGDGVTPPASGVCEDIRWDGFLQAGEYIAFLTVFPNLAVGPTLADGFLLQGQGNFTSMFAFGEEGPFLDPDGNRRTGEWDLLIRGDFVSEVPEPASGLLLVAGLGLVWMRRRG